MPKAKQLSVNMFQRELIKRLGIPQFLAEREKEKMQEKHSILNMRDQDYLSVSEEYKVWFSGLPEEIEFFYKSNASPYIYNSHPYYRVVNSDIVRAHYPLAGAISSAFGTLLFNQKPTFNIDTQSSELNAKYEQRLSKFLSTNDILSLLQKAATMQSYSGAVALKLNVDKNLASTPLVTVYPKEQFLEKQEYGQTVYVDFLDYFDGYKLVSRYGRGYISYTLYDSQDKRVPLEEHERTVKLKDIAFFDEKQLILPLIFAVVVPNKAGSKSDYDGLISSFHALDENYSAMINYIRKTKPNIFISEDIAKKDQNGKPLPLNTFDNAITVLDSTPAGETTKIDRDLPEILIQGYRDAFESIREIILVKVNLSPGTLGLPSGGARESSMALNIRERASMRARAEKLAIWEEKLGNFIYAAIVLDELINEATEAREGVYVYNLPDSFATRIDFGPFTELSLSERIAIYKEALTSGLCSVEFALTQIWGDQLTDEELENLVIQTKLQRNIPLDAGQQQMLAAQGGDIQEVPVEAQTDIQQ